MLYTLIEQQCYIPGTSSNAISPDRATLLSLINCDWQSLDHQEDLMSSNSSLTMSNHSSWASLQLQWRVQKLRPIQKYCLLLVLTILLSSYGQPRVAIADTCVSTLTDGGFENGARWVSKNNDGFPLLSSQLARSGLRGAYLGGRNTITDRLSTQLSLPSDAQTITMNFWWQLQSQESATKGGDRITVLVATEEGIPLQTLLELSGRNVTHEWRTIELDLTRFAGQFVQLQFLASTDADQITDFFVDDIEIIACDTVN